MKRNLLLIILLVTIQMASAQNNTMDKKISRYPVPEINELPEDVQAIHKAAIENFGMVPNVAKALSHRPEQLKAFLGYDEALKREGTGLTDKEREILIVAFSAKNGCQYCVQSHGAQVRILSGNPQLSDQVAINYKEADITPRERAMIDFGMKVSFNSASIDENDFEVLKKHGFSDEDIWDIAAVTAFYNMSNRMMNFLAVRPDDVFYNMGR